MQQASCAETCDIPSAGETLAAAESQEAESQDAVARRTRAQQSLIDFSIEELEAELGLASAAEEAKAAADAEYEAFICVSGPQGSQAVALQQPEH